MQSRVDISAWGEQPPLWIRLVADEVNRCGTLAQVSERVGICRSALSMALRGCYPAGTDGLERKVLKFFRFRACPAQQGEQIAADACQSFRQKKYPAHNPQAIGQWVEHRKLCQQCPHCPDSERKEVRHASAY